MNIQEHAIADAEALARLLRVERECRDIAEAAEQLLAVMAVGSADDVQRQARQHLAAVLLEHRTSA